jgi:hypothetical protein
MYMEDSVFGEAWSWAITVTNDFTVTFIVYQFRIIFDRLYLQIHVIFRLEANYTLNVR